MKKKIFLGTIVLCLLIFRKKVINITVYTEDDLEEDDKDKTIFQY